MEHLMSQQYPYHEAPVPTPPWDPQPPKRKRRAWPWVLSSVLVFALLLAGGCAALLKGAADTIGEPNAVTSSSSSATPTEQETPTDEPSEEPTDDGPMQLQIGQGIDVTQDDADDTEAVIKVLDVQTRKTPIDSWLEGPKNGRFVIFTVRINGKAGKFQFNAADFYVKSRTGDRYNGDDGNAWEATHQDQLDFSTINGGEHKRGPMAFDVNTRHGELVYDPNYEGQPLAVWSF